MERTASIPTLLFVILFLVGHGSLGPFITSATADLLPVEVIEQDDTCNPNVTAPCHTEVVQRDPNQKPIKGMDIQLKCTNITPGCRETSGYKWYRGTALLGTQSRIFTIVKLDNTNDGKYTCQFNNTNGCEEKKAYTLKVEAFPITTLTVKPDPPITQGTQNVTLTCDGGVNSDAYTWYLNDTKMDSDKWPDKSVYVIGKPRHINLGLYKCEVTNGVGTGVAYYNLNIFFGPEGTPSLSPNQATILADTDWPLTCETKEPFYKGNPVATRYGWEYNGDEQKGEESYQFNLHLKKVTDKGNVTCVLANYFGKSNSSAALYAVVHAPVMFELPDEVLVVNYPMVQGESHTFSVNVSGTEVTSARISRPGQDDNLIQKGNFKLTLNESVEGDFLYGQTSGWQWTIDWSIPKTNEPCDDFMYFSGSFDLTAEGRAAGNVSRKSINLELNGTFSPHWKGPKTQKVATGQNVSIDCSICMNPMVYEYVWIFDSGNLPSDIKQRTAKAILIEDFKDKHYGKYSCTPSGYDMKFVIEVVPPSLAVGLIVGLVAGSLAVIILVTVLIVCLVKRKRRAAAGAADVETHSQHSNTAHLDQINANREAASKKKKDKNKKKKLPSKDELDNPGMDMGGEPTVINTPLPHLPVHPILGHQPRPESEHIYEPTDGYAYGDDIYDDTDMDDGGNYLNMSAPENPYVPDGPGGSSPPWRM